jgi:hypothetical protein
MSKSFKSVKEVISWKNFILTDLVYDLSHLNAQWVKYIDEKDQNNPIKYRFIVTYGLHCFTKDSDKLSSEELQSLNYKAPKESRAFNLERYELSKYLPKIIASLGDQSTLVCHAGYGKFAIIRVVDSRGNEVDYFVVFTVFKEEKKLRLHIQSAYPKYEGVGKIKKVGFFVIARNLLNNKKLPSP